MTKSPACFEKSFTLASRSTGGRSVMRGKGHHSFRSTKTVIKSSTSSLTNRAAAGKIGLIKFRRTVFLYHRRNYQATPTFWYRLHLLVRCSQSPPDWGRNCIAVNGSLPYQATLYPHLWGPGRASVPGTAQRYDGTTLCFWAVPGTPSLLSTCG